MKHKMTMEKHKGQELKGDVQAFWTGEKGRVMERRQMSTEALKGDGKAFNCD